jgi:hypothetical protein
MNSKERSHVSVDGPTLGDLQMATHAMLGIFQVLSWIDGEHIEGIDDAEVDNVRAAMVLAGRKFAQGLCDRF